ncbi:MAG: fumarylacetoacetate hydrolase family protein [Planctomycetota bacterium]|nr:fumarylacetoacetate hydrolase family protein [Planctomycetota bacterium]
MQVSHLGQYWSAERREVRLLAAADVGLDEDGSLQGDARDLTDVLPLPRHRRGFRDAQRGRSWPEVEWTYTGLPFPSLELLEWVESSGRPVAEWLRQGFAAADRELSLASLDGAPSDACDHLVCPMVPRRALAFGVTYLNSALERETEGKRRDYAYVYKAVKNRRERPEIFLKGTSPEHFVGPNGKMGLRRDRSNTLGIDGEPCEALTVSSGIEPELAALVSSRGRIWGYTLADDVSGNRIENETLLYLAQAKFFTGALVLGPVVLLSDEQDNPQLEITTRIHAADGECLFERTSQTSRINAPLHELISWASSHIALTPGEVLSTGTDVVPDGRVKVLDEGMRVEISCPQIGCLRHGAAYVPEEGDLNLNYSRLEFESRREE